MSSSTPSLSSEVVLKKAIALIFHLLPPTKKLKESNKGKGFLKNLAQNLLRQSDAQC